MRTAEFDEFGPWILQVHTEAEIPRLFRELSIDLAASRLVLKVPRDITRRDANPEMDLYDHLLVVGPDTFTVASRHGGQYVEAVMPFDQIAVITDDVSLLDGRLTVHPLTGEALTVGYHGSSQPLVGELVALLRDLAAGTAPGRDTPSTSTPGAASAKGVPVPELRTLGDQDVALVTSYRELLRQEPQVQLLAAHGRRVVRPRGGAGPRALHLARRTTLQGVVIGTDAQTLYVLCRRAFLVRGNRPVHSIVRVVVRLDTLDSVTTQEHPRYVGVSVVVLRAGAASIQLLLPTDSAAERALVGAPRSR